MNFDESGLSGSESQGSSLHISGSTPITPVRNGPSNTDNKIPEHYNLRTLFSQHELPMDLGVNDMDEIKSNLAPPIPLSRAASAQLPRRKIHTKQRRSSNASIGAMSVNSKNVRFNNTAQAKRALNVSNALHSLQRERSLSRSHSRSISTLFRKKRKQKAFLAKIAANVPVGFDPKRRRGSIIRTTSRRSTTAGDLPKLQTVASVETDLEEDGKRHRESKEIIDFEPKLAADRNSNKIEEIAFELPNIPGTWSNLKYYCSIIYCLSVIVLLQAICFRLFSDQSDAFLYPVTNVGARVLNALLAEPLFIICIFSTIIVINRQYIQGFHQYNKTFVSIFFALVFLNILKMSLSNCVMDFIYNLALFSIICALMILPFFSADKWRDSRSVLLLFSMWIGVILIGFTLLVLHQFVANFIIIMFYLLIVAWIAHFWHYKKFGVLDPNGQLSAFSDSGYCALLIPALLLFPLLGSAVIVNVNSKQYSIFGYFVVLKLTFFVGRGLWESTALKATGQTKYAHLMFPIFFIEELTDCMLLIRLQLDWVNTITFIVLMAVNHFVRDGDVAYKYIYKQWIIPMILRFYDKSSKNEKNLNMLTVNRVPQKMPISQRNRVKTHSVVSPSINTNDLRFDDGVVSEVDIYDDDYIDEHSPINQVKDEVLRNSLEIEIDDSTQYEQTKQLNLAQEQDEIHLARVIVHFQMFRFSEFCARFAVILLLLLDKMFDAINIGNDSLSSDHWHLILLVSASIVITLGINQISQRILSRDALISIQSLKKLECIDEFSASDRVFIHVWVIFGDHCRIFKRFWMFFAFVIGYQIVIILQAHFAATNNGLFSICLAFF